MRKVRLTFIAGMCLCFFLHGSVFAGEKPDETVLQSLSKKLMENGVTQNEIENLKAPLSDLLNKKADPAKITSLVIALKAMNINGRLLADSIVYMKELTDAGEDPGSAGEFILEAARSISERGINGKNLISEIKKTVMRRKQDIIGNSLKEQE
ncbi:MAG: hypothetical protein ABH883_03940 [Candidatus Omnitrophota bacterium]